ncbi:thioesterase [Defluviimonas sp. 20V17]|nr:PaaI family thioesterase [Allgaiera indica]KDB03424.1 thioesterase [Defluviimonas sp. 20V17]SDW63458.1 uncharacterized domain 1-containing protein [Allgaiera indica]
MTPDDLLSFARRIFAAQPFSSYLGAELRSVGPGRAEITLALRPELTQQHGFAHGGVISYLADNALTFAGGLALGGDALTSEYKLNYLRPARGLSLLARAETLSVGKRQAVCRCIVLACDDRGDETACAAAQGTIIRAVP